MAFLYFLKMSEGQLLLFIFLKRSEGQLPCFCDFHQVFSTSIKFSGVLDLFFKRGLTDNATVFQFLSCFFRFFLNFFNFFRFLASFLDFSRKFSNFFERSGGFSRKKADAPLFCSFCGWFRVFLPTEVELLRAKAFKYSTFV